MSTPVDKLLDMVEWRKLSPITNANGTPYATHEGILKIGIVELRVYQLNTGQRVIHSDDLKRFFEEAKS